MVVLSDQNYQRMDESFEQGEVKMSADGSQAHLK